MKLQRKHVDNRGQVIEEEVIETDESTTIGAIFREGSKAKRVIIYRTDDEAIVWTKVVERGN